MMALLHLLLKWRVIMVKGITISGIISLSRVACSYFTISPPVAWRYS